MINHLLNDIGWTTTIMALAILLVCLPALFAWGTWEIRRYGRALRGARVIDAPDFRFAQIPAAASLPRGSAAGSPAILDDNVVSLERWSVGA